MSFLKKTIADMWTSGHSTNEIVHLVCVIKRLQGNTCVKADDPTGYAGRLERYVRSEIARLERKKPRSSTSSTLSLSPCDRPTAGLGPDQPTSPSSLPVLLSPILQALYPLAHISDTTSTSHL